MIHWSDRLAGDDDGRIQHILVVDFARDIGFSMCHRWPDIDRFHFWPGIWNPCLPSRYLVDLAACCWPWECGETVRSDMKSATARDMAKAEIGRGESYMLLGWFVDLGDGDVREFGICRLLLIEDFRQKIVCLVFPSALAHSRNVPYLEIS